MSKPQAGASRSGHGTETVPLLYKGRRTAVSISRRHTPSNGLDQAGQEASAEVDGTVPAEPRPGENRRR